MGLWIKLFIRLEIYQCYGNSGKSICLAHDNSEISSHEWKDYLYKLRTIYLSKSEKLIDQGITHFSLSR